VNLYPNVPTFQTNDIFTRFGNAINYLLNRVQGPSGESQWVPLVTGSEPPTLVSDGSGNLIFVAWSPDE
jgi:hypothetical protein